MRYPILLIGLVAGGCSADLPAPPTAPDASDATLDGAIENDDGQTAGANHGDPQDGSTVALSGEELSNGMFFIELAPVEWEMGMTSEDPDYDLSHTPHMVELTHEWSMSETEVTYGQWLELMDYDPRDLWMQSMVAAALTEDMPVGAVSWHEAQAYANALSRQYGLDECTTCYGDGYGIFCEPAMDPYSCNGFRLPTEAEWETAAWGGESFTYPGSDDINTIGWWEENSDSKAHEVGTKTPNGYGLYDMGGNIREMVYDWSADYPSTPQVNPVVYPEDGVQAVERGGSWACRSPELRPNRRNLVWAYDRDEHTGFRLVRITD